MKSEQLIKTWFEKWTNGDFVGLPLSDDFVHTIPYGPIRVKSEYLKLAMDNREMFTGNKFEKHNTIFGKQSACVRNDDFSSEPNGG